MANPDSGQPEPGSGRAGPVGAEPSGGPGGQREPAGQRRNGRRKPVRALLHGVHYGVRSLWQILGSLIVGTLALGIVIALMPGIGADSGWAVLGAVVLVSITGALLLPVLAVLADALGWFGVFVIGLLSQGIVVYIGLMLARGIHVDGFWPAFWASWAYALIAAILSWLLLVDDDEAFLSHVMRQATRGHRSQTIADPDVEGVVMVQIDGLPWPLLQLMVSAGNLPTISRWVRSGSHVMREWTARVPCTTPVSQAGILHGSTEGMPAFRWYEKDSGKLLVANRPADAAVIQARLSDGCGLLPDDGASISNLFSGDATVSLLSMSGMAAGTPGLGPSKSYSSFFMHPYGFPRALFLTIGEILKERHQARAQVRAGIEPRIDRHGSYQLLRGVTNVLLRDLNLALIAEQMVIGRKAIYVDFVDYDEIAHHAGPVRPESLRSLTGLDEVLAQLERIAEQVQRRYHLVVVSDHGQSQGSTFRQRYGVGLEDVVRELMGGGDLAAVTSSVEDWGPVNTFLSQMGAQGSVSGGMLRRALRRRTDAEGSVALGPSSGDAAAVGGHDLVVVGSGNLGLVWFAHVPGRLTLEALEALHPGLVGALANHPGVGWVLVQTDADDPVVLGRQGLRRLASGEVEGLDPLHAFPQEAAADLLRVARFANAPDVYVGSLYEPSTLDVAAFEELVGSHGGLGGWQTEAVLVHPAGWPLDVLEDSAVAGLPDSAQSAGSGHPGTPDSAQSAAVEGAASLAGAAGTPYVAIATTYGRTPADLAAERQAEVVLHGAEMVHRQLVRWLEALGHRRNIPTHSRSAD